MKRPTLPQAAGWFFDVAVVAFWIWIAKTAYDARHLFTLMLACFALGERWARAFFELRLARQEKLRVAWEQLARNAIDRCNEQHAVFIEMGPPLEVLRDYFAGPSKPTTSKGKAN